MENPSLFNEEASEKARNSYLLAIFLKLLWTLLTLLALLGLLIPLTIFLGWWKFALPCVLGVLTGISLAAGLSASIQNRALITLLLGVLILPGLGIYVSLLAGINPQAFEASSSALMPFVANALAALIAGIIIMKIWQNMPIRERQEDEGKEPVAALTQAAKERTSHEGPDLNKAA